ncbi:MAG: UbiX family flavin prenyltransferase [Planctomycetota bacterium]|nr:UbiX family flavin prenyltransferase [Planctomycetota bacterium]MDA1214213.1 UbiX family flavin prenyltransferase [Planctomycetota bacterium]
MKNFVLAITGASGSVYAVRLLDVLLYAGYHVQLTISPAGAQVLKHELGLNVDLNAFASHQILPDDSEVSEDSVLSRLRRPHPQSEHVVSSVLSESETNVGKLTYHHYQDFSAGIASGSFLTAGMVICPCSMGTLGSLANGMSQNLIHRAADVHLKERRKLIVVPRETPLSSIQLENMKRLSDNGVIVLPAMPGFYHNPLSLHDLVDFVVARICDQLGIKHEMTKRWGNDL